jgi:hypothetical protein
MKIMDRVERKDWRTKRQRFAWDSGFRAGRSTSDLKHEAETFKAREIAWKIQAAEAKLYTSERLLKEVNQTNEELKRELQFARDRIEQLANSVVIIREGKK